MPSIQVLGSLCEDSVTLSSLPYLGFSGAGVEGGDDDSMSRAHVSPWAGNAERGRSRFGDQYQCVCVPLMVTEAALCVYGTRERK